MKKSKIILKSLIGIPMGIFILEMLNIIFSLQGGEYIRLDGLANGINLKSVLLTYLYCSVYSYLAMFFSNYSLEIEKMEISLKEKDKKTRKIAILGITTLFILPAISLIVIPNNYESVFGFCASIIYPAISGIINIVKNLLSEYTIKQINEKLKERFKE